MTASRSWADRISQSPNYKKNSFQNLVDTPVMLKEASYWKVLKDSLTRPKTVKPAAPLPSVKTDLRSLQGDKPVIVWMGHSSYLIHIKGVNILVDPVLSGHAAPFSFMVRAFPGADIYTPADLPPIDMLIITHNHYDHLDAAVIGQIAPSTKTFYTSLGVGSDLEQMAGKSCPPVVELDWWEKAVVSEDIELTATPARHFSGRGLKRGGSLWSSFVLKAFGYTLFLGGDSGYGEHFKTIGQQYGPFDIALLECGQYGTYWPYIHMAPEETVQAAQDLQAQVLMPVHWAKFALAVHPWKEPIERLTKAAHEKNMTITTPKIGEPVVLGEALPAAPWWEGTA